MFWRNKINLQLYQNTTSLFQSDIWGEFANNVPGLKRHKLNDFIIVEYGNLIYTTGITKNQLEDLNLLIDLAKFVKGINTLNKQIFIDFQILENDIIVKQISDIMNKYGFVTTRTYLTPRQRAIVDLSFDLKEIKDNYKSKTFNDITRAKKNGVKVVEDWDINQFYKLYLQTSDRHRFSPQPFEYFDSLINVLKQTGNGKLLFAGKEEYSCTAIIAEYNNILYYLYAGSNDKLNYLNASSVLQDYIIELAKKSGYNFYDLMGVRSDLNYGPTKFKLKFATAILKLVNAFTEQ